MIYFRLCDRWILCWVYVFWSKRSWDVNQTNLQVLANVLLKLNFRIPGHLFACFTSIRVYVHSLNWNKLQLAFVFLSPLFICHMEADMSINTGRIFVWVFAFLRGYWQRNTSSMFVCFLRFFSFLAFSHNVVGVIL